MAHFRRVARGRFGPVLVAIAMLMPVATDAASDDRTRPGYATIILDADDTADAELARFMESAGRALWRFSSGFGKSRPASPAGEVFTESVAVYLGTTELTPDDRFDLLGRIPRDEVLAMLGQMAADEPIRTIGAQAGGARIVNALIADGMARPNDQLQEELCTASFERLTHARMTALLEATGTTIEAWGVAALPGDEADYFRGSPPLRWERGQLLHVDVDAPPIRSCCWGYVVMPDGSGSYVQFAFGRGAFLPYLSSHACFTRTPDGWRLSTIALRMRPR